ncbi:MAG: hypothetical protein JO211_08310 [Acidobacteriaceae bacterium]|nr:hypothetical protein [Acidobacteriaceae bacterium]
MNPDQALTVTMSALLSAFGWVVGYSTTIRRDRLAKKRDLRTQYLLDAYRQLERTANRREPTEADEKALEGAIADIQLLGSPKQVHLARRFALEFAESRTASFDELLEELREDLRKELSLPPLRANRIQFLRIVRSQSPGGNRDIQ